MVALPGNLLFHQFHHVGIRIALDVQPIPHHLDHRPGALVNQVGDVERASLCVDLHRLDPDSLACR